MLAKGTEFVKGQNANVKSQNGAKIFVIFEKFFVTFVVKRKSLYDHEAHKEGTKDTKAEIIEFGIMNIEV